jgi:two-component system chemotaxis response regulator CheB
VGEHAVGVLLTGMGADGAQGMLKMKQSGGFTIAQDEASSVVYGMPREAFRLGAVDRVLSLSDIAAAIGTAVHAVGCRA